MPESPPIATAHLFPRVARELHLLLADLSPEEWDARGEHARWAVRDIAAHLLDGSLRRLSSHRDRYTPSDARTEFDSYDDLLGYLNSRNADWTAVAQRLSPGVLLELLDDADRRLAEFFASENGDAPALWPVAWAGEASSLNWFDIAREYTEKWHHTQQIFEITGRASTLIEHGLMHPVLDTFLRALPHAFRLADAPPGTHVHFAVRGEFSGDWRIVRELDGWTSVAETGATASATISCTPRSMWKLCTTRTTLAEALAQFPDLRVSGDARLAVNVGNLVTVMI